MLSELVIDTNVLAHCHNTIEPRAADALRLTKAIIAGNQVLCVDEGFSMEEARNRSLIGAEYLKHLRVGTPGYAMVAHLAQRKRIRSVPKRPTSSRAKRRIDQIIRNTSDRAFVGVAWHSAEHVLVSHDFTDFDQAKRDTIAREIGVEIVEAVECCRRL